MAEVEKRNSNLWRFKSPLLFCLFERKTTNSFSWNFLCITSLTWKYPQEFQSYILADFPWKETTWSEVLEGCNGDTNFGFWPSLWFILSTVQTSKALWFVLVSSFALTLLAKFPLLSWLNIWGNKKKFSPQKCKDEYFINVLQFSLSAFSPDLNKVQIFELLGDQIESQIQIPLSISSIGSAARQRT